MDCYKLKEKIITHCTDIFQRKLLIVNDELKHLSAAIAEDTKSSAGDKYETGREMANLEKEKLHAQVLGFKNSLATLSVLPQGTSNHVDLGSLIKTDKGWIHISISLGQIGIDGEKVIVISPLAPLAQLMMKKVEGETVSFRSTDYQILNIC